MWACPDSLKYYTTDAEWKNKQPLFYKRQYLIFDIEMFVIVDVVRVLNTTLCKK